MNLKKTMLLSTLALSLLAPAAAHAKRYSFTMTYGQDVVVAGKDDVSVRARCVQNEDGSGFDVLRIYAVTANNAVTRGANTYQGNGSYLTSTDLPVDSTLLVISTPSGAEYFSNSIDSGFVLNLTTKTGFAYAAESTVMGLNSGGTNCRLSINLDSIKKFKAASN